MFNSSFNSLRVATLYTKTAESRQELISPYLAENRILKRTLSGETGVNVEVSNIEPPESEQLCLYLENVSILSDDGFPDWIIAMENGKNVPVDEYYNVYQNAVHQLSAIGLLIPHLKNREDPNLDLYQAHFYSGMVALFTFLAERDEVGIRRAFSIIHNTFFKYENSEHLFEFHTSKGKNLTSIVKMLTSEDEHDKITAFYHQECVNARGIISSIALIAERLELLAILPASPQDVLNGTNYMASIRDSEGTLGLLNVQIIVGRFTGAIVKTEGKNNIQTSDWLITIKNGRRIDLPKEMTLIEYSEYMNNDKSAFAFSNGKNKLVIT